MDFIRHQHGASIALPDRETIKKAFSKFVAEVRAGGEDGGAALTFKDGKLTVSGVKT